MKKILNLIGALTLVATATTPVVSCGGNKSKKAPPEPNHPSAQNIIDKINKTDLAVADNTNPLLATQTTKIAIKTALKNANKNLTTANLKYLTVQAASSTSSAQRLIKSRSVNVKIVATVQGKTANKMVSVILEDTATGIIGKIPTATSLTLPAGTNNNASNSNTKTIINTALASEINNGRTSSNPVISDWDIAQLSYTGIINSAGAATPISVTATVAGETANKRINITIAKSDAQKVQAISDKINTANLTVPAGTNPSTINPQTVTAIKTALKSTNAGLTNEDLNKIRFNGGTLVAGTPANITVVIRVGRAFSNTKTLHVTLAQTDQQKADLIKAKITDVALDVPPNTDPSTDNSQTITAIKTALEADNSTLNTADLAKITFNSTTLTAGSTAAVIATITVGPATPSITLNVTLAKTNAQKANSIKQKIADAALDVPAGTNPSTANAQTATGIKTALKADNPTLTAADLAKITFNSTTLTRGTAKAVTATITVGTGAQAATATRTLNVTLAQTDLQKANAIKNKIGDIDLTLAAGTNASTDNSATIIEIKRVLKADNSSLNDNDLTKFSFSTVTLVAGTAAANVTATITVGTDITTKTLNILLPKTAAAIKADITNSTLVIASNVLKTIAANTDAIKLALLAANSSLTVIDLTSVTFSASGDFVPGNALAVNATISDGATTETKVLTITMALTDQDKTQAIANKINNNNVSIPSFSSLVPKSTTDNTIKTQIKDGLKTTNPTLTTADLTKITIPDGVNLDPSLNPTQVTVGIRFSPSSTIVNKTINVTVTLTPSQQQTIIDNKIDRSTHLRVVYNGDVTSTDAEPGAVTALKNALKVANPSLTQADLSNIQVSNSSWTAHGRRVIIYFIIVIPGTTNLRIPLACNFYNR